MKIFKYLSAVALVGLLSACNEDPELPPVYQFTPNTTILELKQAYWQSDADYVSTVGLTNGEHTVFRGRVISSDESGNIYKSVMVSDGTAAITIAINSYDLYKRYAYGQEVLVDATYLKIGGYKGLMQIGGETTSGSTSAMTFMASDSLAVHIHQSGGINAAAVEPILTTIPELTNAKATADGLMAWQSQLIKIEGLTFENAGQQFAPTQNENRYMKDAQGNRMNLRCSSYSDFHNDVIPSGTGSVTGILSYYGSDWQMLLIDLSGLEGFNETPDTPDTPQPGDGGTLDKPYTVEEVMALGNPGSSAWVEGKIVGVMNYIDGTGNVFSATDLTTNSNIVIASTAADYGTNYVAVQLPIGAVRDALNLVEHPENIGKEAKLYGSLEKYCGVAGMKSTSAAVFDGKEIGTMPGGSTGGDLYVRATSLTSGGSYLFWTDNTLGQAMPSSAYSWLTVSQNVALEADGSLKADGANAYTFTETPKGWTIQSANGVYLYMQGTYNSFQLGTALDESNNAFFWTVTPAADGRFEIVNKANGKMIQYSAQYKSYGAYTDLSTGSKPYLYQPAN